MIISSINTVFLFISNRCNLSCNHCYISASPNKGIDMSFPAIKRSLELFSKYDIQDFRITGGEPTLHPMFYEIVTFFFERGYKIGLTTNGMNLFSTHLMGILDMLSRCWVSVYGLTANRNNFISGIPVPKFHNLLKMVDENSKAGYPIGISAILTPHDKNLVSSFIDLIYSHGIKRLRFLFIEPDGRAKTHMNINWKDWQLEVRYIYEIIKNHLLASHFDIISVSDPFDLDNRYKHPDDSCLLMNRRMWSVLPIGEIYPCCFNVYPIKTKSVSNIFEASVVEKLSAYSNSLQDNINCRGLNPSYWKLRNLEHISCPISAITI